MILTSRLRGLVKSKKNPKILEKNVLARHNPPTPLSIFFKHVQYNTKKHTHKNTQKIRVGLNPPTLQFFSGFWICFNLTRPLSLLVSILLSSQKKSEIPRKKNYWPDTTLPPLYLFFLNMCNITQKNTQKTRKNPSWA